MGTAPLRGISNVRVFVSPDAWDAAVRFYVEKLGLMPRARDDETGFLLFGFELPATLLVERVDPGGDEDAATLVGRFTGVSLSVRDILEIHRGLSSRGVKFTGPPERQPWGGWLAHFEDPVGNVLTLVQDPS